MPELVVLDCDDSILDRAGNLIGLPSGTWTSFRALKEQGLNTASNYYLAQSVLWPDVKIAALRAENGDVYGHRYEARMFGVGAHQHQSAFLITNALAFHDELALRVDELLERFGFDQARPEESHALLLKAYEAARNHGGNFMNIPFGSGNMRDFARGFADLIEIIGDDWDVEEEIQPLLSICRTGCTDAKVNRILFPTLTDTIKFQRTYDSAILENPNRSARQIFDKELQRSSNQGFKDCCC